jgi:hypothetical protein
MPRGVTVGSVDLVPVVAGNSIAGVMRIAAATARAVKEEAVAVIQRAVAPAVAVAGAALDISGPAAAAQSATAVTPAEATLAAVTSEVDIATDRPVRDLCADAFWLPTRPRDRMKTWLFPHTVAHVR